jgi:hypothetical protein
LYSKAKGNLDANAAAGVIDPVTDFANVATSIVSGTQD